MSADDKQIGEWLKYSEDGKLYWLKTASSRAMKGSEAGWFDKDGYLVTTLKGKKMRVARLVWEMHYGAIPKGMHIDHINNNIVDNRIENLRLATPKQNASNRRKQSNNTAGAKGCTFVAGKYQVYIDNKYVGRFATLDAAISAYNTVAKFLHGEFINVSR